MINISFCSELASIHIQKKITFNLTIKVNPKNGKNCKDQNSITYNYFPQTELGRQKVSMVNHQSVFKNFKILLRKNGIRQKVNFIYK